MKISVKKSQIFCKMEGKDYIREMTLALENLLFFKEVDRHK